MPTGVLACCNGVRKQTNHNEEVEVTLIDKLGNESSIAFLYTCPCLLDLIQQRPTTVYLLIESVDHQCLSFDVLGNYADSLDTDHEQKPKGIPKQEELSSFPQQSEALVDIQTESSGRLETVT